MFIYRIWRGLCYEFFTKLHDKCEKTVRNDDFLEICDILWLSV